MAKRYQRVEVYKKEDSGWHFLPTVLDAYSVTVMTGVGKFKDSFDFKLSNPNNKLFRSSSVIAEDDRIKIYFWKNVEWSSLTYEQQVDALVMDGVVSEFSQDIGKNREITIKGTGFMDIVFRGLVFVRDSSLTKPHLIIQNIIAQLNSYNPTRKIYGATPAEWDNLGNATTKPDGTDFDDIQFSSSYKSAIEVVEEISSNEYTKAGGYNYMVRYNPTAERYEFLWNWKTVNQGESIPFTEGVSDIREFEMGQNKEKVINAIIYNVGFDCNDICWEFLYYDLSQGVSGTTSWKYINVTYILSNLILQEYESDPSSWATSSDGRRKENYPLDSAYPWTFQFSTRNDSGDSTGTKATASDDEEFNDAIVTEGEWRGKEIAAQVVDGYGRARWEGSLTVPSETINEAGDLISLTSPSFNLKKLLIRAKEVDYTILETTYKIEEDEKSIVLESGEI